MVSITLAISGIVAIIAGITVIAFPKLIRLVIGLYLILIGVLRLIDLPV